MRDQKTWSVRFISVLGVALAVGVLLALGSTAASARGPQPGPGAVRDGRPVQFLELDKIEPSAGVVIDTKETIGGSLAFRFLADLGRRLPSPRRGRWGMRPTRWSRIKTARTSAR